MANAKLRVEIPLTVVHLARLGLRSMLVPCCLGTWILPSVPVARADEPTGQRLYESRCAACHGAGATGDSVGGGQIAPSLALPTATQIGEAIRTGPGEMPRFGTQTLSDHDVNSLARYLIWIRDNGKEGGLQLGRVGAVAEGLMAVVIGLGIMLLVIRLTGSTT